ncbi:uncharacterized protein LOC135215517 [Macrobrachium nipponense]|uniref:uncharacterized protein LOC135215517 n=1 Tax=Macrobrachium nipponense TaxID=159736 RepID=UPI0030C7C868
MSGSEMLWEPRGCCGMSLRTGSLCLGSLVLVGALLSLAMTAEGILTYDFSFEVVRFCNKNVHWEQDRCQVITKYTGLTIVSLHVIINIAEAVFSSMLIHGIRKNKTRLMVPLMVLCVSQIILLIMISMLPLAVLAYIHSWEVFLVAAGLFGSIIFVETYFVLVLRAYWLEVKRNKAQVHLRLEEEEDDFPKCIEEGKNIESKIIDI